MLQAKNSDRRIARAQPAARRHPAPPSVPEGMNPMVGVKLWHNPCRLSFRVNFIAHHFNQPVYDWIARAFDLTGPEHVVLYAIGLREGITAEDVAASSARPRNTLSRAVNRLLHRKLIHRIQDSDDRRRRLLYLTAQGRHILDETVPLLVAREEMLLEALSAEERETLNYLMTKVILNQAAWPTRIDKED
ncbi:MAG: MarR family winged helix-turn-helix transcriptional regulator [Burkholderiaceae bacterium]|nr:MarR family winged helix-turn-helix transcriptional regulator [Burkholderiaceae bacterium]